jgi:hypothetical protein
MLRYGEIDKLRNGSWELDCSLIRLRPNSPDQEAFEGPGYIKNTSDGQILFKLYSSKPLKPGLELKWSKKRPRGKLIPDELQYTLSATDIEGRHWEAEKILPYRSGFVSAENNTICGDIPFELRHIKKTKYILANACISMSFFHLVDRYIPRNIITKTDITIEEQDLTANPWGANIAKFSSCDCNFTISQGRKDGTINLSIESNQEKFPEGIEHKAIETLQFILAHPLCWTVLEQNENGVETVIINGQTKKELTYRIYVPVHEFIDRKGEYLWKLFDKYLSYILKYKGKTKWHPMSIFIYRVILSSAAYLETFALETAVAIEGLLLTEFKALASPTVEFVTRLSKVSEFINTTSGVDDTLKLRICGAIADMKKSRATDKLRALVKSGIIEEKEYKTWKKLRNKSTHPTQPAFVELQKLLDLCNIVITLFYKLIFHTIGYEGKYMDYGTYDYSSKDFPPVGKD